VRRFTEGLNLYNPAPQRPRHRRTRTFAAAVVLFGAIDAWADSHPTGVPALSSRPGAAYTIYLDFGGFNFDGTWGDDITPVLTPGSMPAYDGTATNFGATDQSNISQIWARAAEKYAPFNINVTTVDPAVAAGQASTDAQRQAYYDEQSQFMHTVIGTGSWDGQAGGVSYIGVDSAAQYNASSNGGAGLGYHTDFVFTNYLGGAAALQNIGEAASHENGHGFGLFHQSDYNSSGGLVSEYSSSNGSSGPGSFAPVMGSSYNAQRGLWRNGTSDNGSSPGFQNDVGVIVSNPGMGGFINDGIGHTVAAATPMPLSGSAVNYSLAKGVIVPVSASSPAAIGAANYTSDYFAFTSPGGVISLTANDGGERVTPGTADPGAVLFSTLSILNSSGGTLYTASTNSASLSETISQVLPAGTYYAEVSSYGGETFVYGGYTNTFFDMGDFFLTGTGITAAAANCFYWTGGGSSAAWNATGPTNWRTNHSSGTDPGTGPGSTTNVFFTVDSGATNLTSTLGANTIINSLNFTGTGTTAGSSSVTIAADGSTLTLAAAAAFMDAAGNAYPSGTGLVVQAGSAAHLIAVPVVLAVSQTWQINDSPANPLTVSGPISGAGSCLTVSGTGSLILSGANLYSGGTNLSGATLIAGSPGALGTGAVTISSGKLDLQSSSGPVAIPNAVTVQAGGTGTVQVPAITGFTVGGIGALTIGAGAKATLSSAGGTAGVRAVLVAPSVSIAGTSTAPTGTFNLAGNDLDLSSGTLAQVTQLVADGYNLTGGANWAGPGITSSTAASNSTHLTALGVVQNNQSGTALFSSSHRFDGDSPGVGDVLVKYTYFGDANLDGRVDGSDYSLIDNGYASHGALTGWYNGDFNYDGVTDGSDYALIDNAFNNQTAARSQAEVAAVTAQTAATPQAVPEPAEFSLAAAAAVMSRRRRRFICCGA
jgi:autotransporter-associated beta strand protein